MPSHKYKKKKKSHKRAKKQYSSNSDDDSLYKVKLSDSESDNSNNGERLTSLVRGSYKNFMQQALSKNFEILHLTSNEPIDEQETEQLVDSWCSVLEQKALRNCMVSELYRTSMVALIRQIKSCSNEGKLFIEQEKTSKLKCKLPLNKETQCDIPDIKHLEMCTSETQTDIMPVSLLELPLPKTSPSSKPYDPAIDFSDSESSCPDVSSSLNLKPPPTTSASLPTNHDVCSITSTTSDLLDPSHKKMAELKPATCSRLSSQRIVENNQSTIVENNQSTIFENNQLTVENKTQCDYLTNNEDSMQFNNQITDLDINKPLKVCRKRRIIVEEDVSSKSDLKDNLDARLNALGLLNDDKEIPFSQLYNDKSKRSNWFAEEIAQSCNLTRVLLRLSTKERERVMKKIKELFGDEEEHLSELSEENITICRKRIASIVVSELTPIYQAKRIASRHLFKFLAKKITKSIMDQSYAPESRSIRSRVKQYFSDGKVIMSESDCT